MKPRIPAPQAAYHASPAGDDSNPGTAECPFATIERARDAVGQVKHNMTGTIEVILGGGTYVVERALLPGAEDSGAGGHDVVCRSRTGERAVLTGIWSAPAHPAAVRRLHVNGRRAGHVVEIRTQQASFTMGPEARLLARLMAGSWSNSACVFLHHSRGAKSPAKVVCHAAHTVRFDGCTFTRLGGAAGRAVEATR